MRQLIARPGPDEYLPYYGTYVNAVPDGDVLEALSLQGHETFELLSTIPEQQATYRYAPGKWSIKDVVQHIADAERVFAYRLLRFARGDASPLASFDENAYAAAAEADRRHLGELAAELRDVRRATVRLVSGLDETTIGRRGIASNAEVSVRALVWIIAGHELHHLRVLRERYLPALDLTEVA